MTISGVVDPALQNWSYRVLVLKLGIHSRHDQLNTRTGALRAIAHRSLSILGRQGEFSAIVSRVDAVCPVGVVLEDQISH